MGKFQGKSLFKAVKTDMALFDGRTLNGDLLCVLMHKVHRLPPDPKIAKSEPKRVDVTSRHHVDVLLDALEAPVRPAVVYPPNRKGMPHHDYSLRYVKDFIDLASGKKKYAEFFQPVEPYPNRFTEPKKVFIATELKAEGALQGLVFKPKKKQGGTGTVWLIAECGKPRPDKARVRAWRAKAEPVVKSEKLQCVRCGENFVERYGDGFVLCNDCEAAPAVIVTGWKKSDWKQNIDFRSSSDFVSNNRKDHGFQDEENYKRKESGKRKNAKCSEELEAKGYVGSTPVSLQEVYRSGLYGIRPLLDYELALLLAVKFPNFTNRNTMAYLKAQRFAAQLAGYFLFQRDFAEIARMVPFTTEESVRKLCKRAHEDHAKYLKACYGREPEEASIAIRRRMLSGLYSPALVIGHLCRSANCCTA